MNPDGFTGRTDEAIMSTLAHEISTSGSRGVEETVENEGDKSKKRVHEKEGPSLR
jgi:hypothetical protein